MAASRETMAPPPIPDHDLSLFPSDIRGKRILLCTESFGPVNGVSRTTLMLVDHLRANGANVAVVAPHNSTKLNVFVPKASPVENPELRIHGYPLPYNPELSIVYPVRLSALIARTFGPASPPDLIYLASPASLGFQLLLQMRLKPAHQRIPVLCNFQTDLAAYCSILFPHPFASFASWTFSKVEAHLFAHEGVKRVFYPSSPVGRYLEKNGVPRPKMRLLARGVNTTLFRPSARSESLRKRIAPRGQIILICVARLAGEKGFEFLGRAAAELDRRGLDFVLHIVGGNRNKDMELEVQRLFDPLVQKGKVAFAGFKVGEELAEAYASADVFLHCSVTETFGLVVLESMASGVPVVARDQGGPSDTVAHGKTGLLVPPGDLAGFADKVMLLATNTMLRQRFAENARKQACEATWDKINNTVAWAMVDAIQAREAESAARKWGTDMPRQNQATMLERLVPRSHVDLLDTKLLQGMSVILGFWGIVGMYLVFIKAAMWLKGKIR